jgi:NACHT domain
MTKGNSSRMSFNYTDISIIDQLERFDSLNRVTEAPYNSLAREFATGCLAGTRTGVLEAIHDWVNNPSSTTLFWLNGAAGTGKSAVAHSIALAYDNEKCRGASFFFSRDQQARRETRFLFQTIAFQLGSGHPSLKMEIAKVLEDQTILTSNLQRQLQKLIFEPLSKIRLSSPPIVVVLDALDESDNEDAVSHVIKLLANPTNRRFPLKFLITSRPETHIRSMFLSPEIHLGTTPLVLHDMKASDIRQDIQSFVRHELTQIAGDCRDVVIQGSWPQEHEIDALVDLSAELFIAAATALKFIRPIRGSRDPRVRLAMILNSTKKGSGAEARAFKYLDQMYTEILKHATGGEPSGVLQTIVGAIVLAFGRLTVDEWSVLLQVEDDIAAALADLQSVILVPKGDAIRTFHNSFRDFLTDSGRCTDENFFVNSPLRHAEMARSCLQRMNSSLRRDICQIGDTTKRNSDIHDLNERRAKFIPGDLQYACQYWALHLWECSPVEPLFELLQSFVFTLILYWIEVLSLIGELGGGLKALRQAQAKLSVSSTPST